MIMHMAKIGNQGQNPDKYLSIRVTLYLDKAIKDILTILIIVSKKISKKVEIVSKRLRVISKRSKIISKGFTVINKSIITINTILIV